MTITAVDELARNLERERERLGLSYKRVERALIAIMGDDAPSDETIASYHQGRIKDRPNVELIVAFAGVYRVPPEHLAPAFTNRIEAMRRLLADRKLRPQCKSPGQPLSIAAA